MRLRSPKAGEFHTKSPRDLFLTLFGGLALPPEAQNTLLHSGWGGGEGGVGEWLWRACLSMLRKPLKNTITVIFEIISFLIQKHFKTVTVMVILESAQSCLSSFMASGALSPSGAFVERIGLFVRLCGQQAFITHISSVHLTCQQRPLEGVAAFCEITVSTIMSMMPSELGIEVNAASVASYGDPIRRLRDHPTVGRGSHVPESALWELLFD